MSKITNITFAGNEI